MDNTKSITMKNEQAFFQIYKSVSRMHNNLIESLTQTNKYKRNGYIIKDAVFTMDSNNRNLHNLATKIVLWGANNSSIKHYTFNAEELQTLEAMIATMVDLHNDNGAQVDRVGPRAPGALATGHMENTGHLQEMMDGIALLQNVNRESDS